MSCMSCLFCIDSSDWCDNVDIEAEFKRLKNPNAHNNVKKSRSSLSIDRMTISTLVNFTQFQCLSSALLSAVGEQNVPLAVRVNIEGLHNVIELSKQCEFEHNPQQNQHRYNSKLLPADKVFFCAKYNSSHTSSK